MKPLNPPSVLVIPFAYPDYPPEDIRRQIGASITALTEAGLMVQCAPVVAAPADVAPAVGILRAGDYDLIVALVVSWVEAPLFVATLRDFWRCPLLLWSHTVYYENGVGLTLGALPAAGVLRETLEEMEAKFAFTYGMPGDEGLLAPIASLARSAATVRALASARVGLLGYASMGMYTGTIDHTRLRRQVGPEIDHLDQYELVVAYEGVTDQEIEPQMADASKWACGERVSEADLRQVFRMAQALRRIVSEHRWDVVTVKCQYELSRTLGMAPCLPLSIMGDEVVSSCEGDVPLAVSQLILHYLTGEPTSYGDLHNVTDSNILWGACGFAPLSYAAGKPVINKHTALYEGLLNSSPYRSGRVTLARLGARRGGFKMHVATGEAVPPPPFHEVGCPVYPFMDIVMDGDPHEFMQEISSQHYAIAYGDVGDELETLCDLLDIELIIT